MGSGEVDDPLRYPMLSDEDPACRVFALITTRVAWNNPKWFRDEVGCLRAAIATLGCMLVCPKKQVYSPISSIDLQKH